MTTRLINNRDVEKMFEKVFVHRKVSNFAIHFDYSMIFKMIFLQKRFVLMRLPVYLL